MRLGPRGWLTAYTSVPPSSAGRPMLPGGGALVTTNGGPGGCSGAAMIVSSGGAGTRQTSQLSETASLSAPGVGTCVVGANGVAAGPIAVLPPFRQARS